MYYLNYLYLLFSFLECLAFENLFFSANTTKAKDAAITAAIIINHFTKSPLFLTSAPMLATPAFVTLCIASLEVLEASVITSVAACTVVGAYVGASVVTSVASVVGASVVASVVGASVVGSSVVSGSVGASVSSITSACSASFPSM